MVRKSLEWQHFFNRFFFNQLSLYNYVFFRRIKEKGIDLKYLIYIVFYIKNNSSELLVAKYKVENKVSRSEIAAKKPQNRRIPKITSKYDVITNHPVVQIKIG